MNTRKLVNLSKGLRRRQTESENILWIRLRDRRFERIKFRRQQQIDKYIVDFISYEAKIVVELDGGQHNQENSIKKDNSRTAFLERQGYRVLRFWDSDILNNINGVLEKLKEVIEEKAAPSPQSSPIKGEADG